MQGARIALKIQRCCFEVWIGHTFVLLAVAAAQALCGRLLACQRASLKRRVLQADYLYLVIVELELRCVGHRGALCENNKGLTKHQVSKIVVRRQQQCLAL
jgi:hypothetical protein